MELLLVDGEAVRSILVAETLGGMFEGFSEGCVEGTGDEAVLGNSIVKKVGVVDSEVDAKLGAVVEVEFDDFILEATLDGVHNGVVSGAALEGEFDSFVLGHTEGSIDGDIMGAADSRIVG